MPPSIIAVTLLAAISHRPVDLAEVLLIVLVEVIGVSLVADRTAAGATALGATLAINWFLIPPYGTLHIASQEDWVFLAVFVAVAVGASTLVESVITSERGGRPVTADADVIFTRGAGRGTGLGLALGQSLAESAGGRLVLSDHAPTRFTLALPLEEMS